MIQNISNREFIKEIILERAWYNYLGNPAVLIFPTGFEHDIDNPMDIDLSVTTILTDRFSAVLRLNKGGIY